MITQLKNINFGIDRILCLLLQIYRKLWRKVETGTNYSTSGLNGEDEAAHQLGICINNSLHWIMTLQDWIVRLALSWKYNLLNKIRNANEID